MVRTNSTMLPLGTELPTFELQVVSKNQHSSDHTHERDLDYISNASLSSRPLLLMVICAHCPFVKHIESQITMIQEDYTKSLEIIGISSNSLLTHPQDGPSNLAHQAINAGWHFPYLLDEDQSFAKSLRAACTPDFFLFSRPSGDPLTPKLVYRGQLDESRPGNKTPVTGADLRFAIDSLLADKPISRDQKPSIGCNIKWHPGNEPSWFG